MAFWMTKCYKIFKNLITKCGGTTKCDRFRLQITTGLQSTTPYKVIQYNNNNLHGVTQKFWEDDVSKELGKM